MSVAVIVPVYNGAEILPVTVPALLALDGVDEWVWVDDGSTDASADLLDALTADEPRARVVRQPANTGRSAARNRGVRETTAPTLVFFDCDVCPPADAVRALTSALASGTASVASIRPLLDGRDDPYAVYLTYFPRGPSRDAAGGRIPWRFFLAGACALRRPALVDAGGFDESIPYGEDAALACRLSHVHPGGLVLAPTTVDLFGAGDLADALGNVRLFGEALGTIEASCPDALRVLGLQSVVGSSWLRALSWLPVPVGTGRLLRALSRPMQARAVRYLLGHALLAAHHGARDLAP